MSPKRECVVKALGCSGAAFERVRERGKPLPLCGDELGWVSPESLLEEELQEKLGADVAEMFGG